MLSTILTAIAYYVSTNMDYILVLVLLIHANHQDGPVLAGDVLGTNVLILLPMALAAIVGAVTQTWMIGFLGLFPLYFGIQALFFPDSGNQMNETDHDSRWRTALHTAIITVTACGADNIAVYIPLFVHRSVQQLVIIYIVMIVMAILFFLIALLISKNKQLERILNRYGRYLAGIIYIYLGLSVLLGSGTIQHFLK
ncbi:cadmium resistance transporter [Fructilactobacillus myrtifloralis]|uniref:Cadmium resistance transporter n=1 Tax=Fructilactobacillus myrtifloralis TaxID=2940301 RepID=A0ABY5BN54_9LACO|nr:cadmium resistance transporter [Fructilactobacillus myrtifloralis]USS84670.1 cadmium resistance transporter [Fructilactobacillus myrtifloralis]